MADSPRLSELENMLPTVTALFVAAGAPEKPVGDAEWFSSENLPSGLPKGARSGIADALSFRGNVVSR